MTLFAFILQKIWHSARLVLILQRDSMSLGCSLMKKGAENIPIDLIRTMPA